MWEQQHPGYGQLNKLMPDVVFSYSSNFSLLLSTTKEHLPPVGRPRPAGARGGGGMVSMHAEHDCRIVWLMGPWPWNAELPMCRSPEGRMLVDLHV